MTKVLQLLLTGLTLGSVYALVALGFVTIYRTSRIVNMAQGSFVMLGSLLTYSFLHQAGYPYWLSGLVAVVLVVLVALLAYLLVLKPLMKASLVSVILGTIGLSILFENVALLKWGGFGLGLPAFLEGPPYRIGEVAVSRQTAWVIGIMLVIVLALWLFMGRTRIGKQMTATASDTEAAASCGVSTGWMVIVAFVISSLIGALGGIAVSPIIPMNNASGGLYTLAGFVAAVLGGWGSSGGAVLGGLMLGIIQSFATGWIRAGYQDAIAFALLIIVLQFRPQGLLGARLSRGED
jgi:branched-chain amino acid transport system permease protein